MTCVQDGGREGLGCISWHLHAPGSSAAFGRCGTTEWCALRRGGAAGLHDGCRGRRPAGAHRQDHVVHQAERRRWVARPWLPGAHPQPRLCHPARQPGCMAAGPVWSCAPWPCAWCRSPAPPVSSCRAARLYGSCMSHWSCAPCPCALAGKKDAKRSKEQSDFIKTLLAGGDAKAKGDVQVRGSWREAAAGRWVLGRGEAVVCEPLPCHLPSPAPPPSFCSPRLS